MIAFGLEMSGIPFFVYDSMNEYERDGAYENSHHCSPGHDVN